MTSVLEEKGPSFVSSRLIVTTLKIVNNPKKELNSAVFWKEDYEPRWDNKVIFPIINSSVW